MTSWENLWLYNIVENCRLPKFFINFIKIKVDYCVLDQFFQKIKKI